MSVAPKFFRWVGSKSKIVDKLLPLFPDRITHTFVSPFLGGGALEMALLAGPAQHCEKIVLADKNPNVIAAWRMCMASSEGLSLLFKRLEWYESTDTRTEGAIFLSERMNVRETCEEWERAARFLYLNQTGWHGLWRENKSGHLNTPRQDTRVFFKAEPVIEQVQAMRAFLVPFRDRIMFRVGDFGLIMGGRPDMARTVTYADPPYLPSLPEDGKTRNFASYVKGGVPVGAHKDLAGYAQECALCVVSNSDTPKAHEIYAQAKSKITFPHTHSVGPQARSRIKIGEAAFVFSRE